MKTLTYPLPKKGEGPEKIGIVWLLLLAALLGGCAMGSSDDVFLEHLERRSFAFFWEQADPSTGLIADRAHADGSNHPQVASIASVGFGLSSICIADHRGWVPHDQAYQRTLATLRFLWSGLPNEHGFYFHFVDMRSGARQWQCELSSIDTALLIAGVVTAGDYYHDTEVESLARRIYERVDWPWMLNGEQTLSMGWTPEKGFIEDRWNRFCEGPLLYLLALGSPTHPLPPHCWNAWGRQPVITYAGRTYVQCPPLFTHQYPLAWFDLRNKRDAFTDYWHNSELATHAQRQFCIDLRGRFPVYGENIWGITASDSVNGYKSWGGPPDSPEIDGTVVPCAAGGSIPFAPAECIAALKEMRSRYGERVWKRYGFVDAFNPLTGWTGPDVIGLDAGITLLMAEDQRTGFVWREFMANPAMRRALTLAGFHSTDPSLDPNDTRYLHRLAHDTWQCIDKLVEPTTGLPYDNLTHGEFTSVSNIGLYLTSVVAAHFMGFIDNSDAERRLAMTLHNIEKLKTWHGFQQSWNSVKTLQPAQHDPWVSLLDSGNLAGGLIVVAEAFPNFHDRCMALVNAMDWGACYDAKAGQLYGGYNTQTGKVNPDWHLPLLGGDSRLACFLAIASGRVPAEMWGRLDRGMEERDNARYLVPGWNGGGLFMQYINGLWLDDRDTLMGRSAQNFTYAQMAHATTKSLPVWGWSACSAPGGEYLGWGKLKDDVVTPHACVLAVHDFPGEVVANLRALEKMGARSPHDGFWDSVELGTGKVSDGMLMLDQAMILVSLANDPEYNIVHSWFQTSPLVRRGRELIPDYARPANGQNVSVYDLRPLPVDLQTISN